MRTVITALVLLLAACAGDAPANGTQHCDGSLYDPCLDEHDCMSMSCRFFMADNIQVCTMGCTPGDDSSCPKTSDGKQPTCNMMAICKPPAANSCTRP